MSNIKHTPAPWEHGNNGLIYGQVTGDSDEAPIVCDVIEDSTMQALGILSETEQANARLIAAAPELLAACIAAANQLALVDDEHFKSAASLVHGAIPKARAAITKAKGEL